MLIQDYLINSAKRFPDKKAIIQPNKTATYSEILNAAKGIACWLIDENLQTGDRVGILTDDPAEYVISYFAIHMAGGTVVALNTQTSTRTLNYIINNCRISKLLAQFKFIKYIHELSDSLPTINAIAVSGFKKSNVHALPFKCMDFSLLVNNPPENKPIPYQSAQGSDSDIAQIIYTSGTTGEPKGVMLRHSNLTANTSSIIEYLKIGPAERHMVVLPFFYSFGNSVLLTHIAAGATLVVLQSFLYPKMILDMMAEKKVTGLSGVASTYALLLNRSPFKSYSFPDLRYITQAGGAMSAMLSEKLQKILPDVDIYIMYGQTEASARLSYLDPNDLLKKPGSIGKAIPGVTLRLFDKTGNTAKQGEVGEIVAQGRNIMAGYWEAPEKTAQVLQKEGLRTGDLAKMDKEGYLYIISRKSDMIKSGAHRIGPKEIEEIILEHDAVHEVAVFGVDDEILGESIKACVVLKEGIKCTVKELMLHCRKNLQAFKVPQHICFCDELPKTASGKIIKHELRNIVNKNSKPRIHTKLTNAKR